MTTCEQRYRHLLEISSLDGAISYLITQLKEHNKFEFFDVSLLEPSGSNFISYAINLPEEYKGIEHTYRRFKYQMLEDEAYTVAFNSKAPFRIDPGTIKDYATVTTTRFERWKMEYQWVFPIIAGQNESARCIGVFSLFTQRNDHHEIDEENIEQLLSMFAPQIERLHEFDDIEEKREQIKFAQTEQLHFLEFITSLNEVTTKDAMFPLITEAFCRYFGVDVASILLKHEDELRIEHTLNLAPTPDYKKKWPRFARSNRYQLAENDGASSLVMVSNKHVLIPDVQQVLHLPMSPKDKKGLAAIGTPRTFLIAPIVVHGSPIGVIWLISLKAPTEFNDQQIELLKMLCTYVGSALRNAETYSLVDAQKGEIEVLNKQLQKKVKELDELASKDRLTGMFNFGSFQEELKRKVNEYQRGNGKYSLALIIVDIDHFKSFNDTYGHLTGNDVLIELADRLQKISRKMDFPARYGGEEFVVLLPKCDLEGAVTHAERLRKAVCSEPFICDGQALKVTISLGCAEFDVTESANQFVARADKALYRAKQNGRNRVEATQEEDTIVAS